MSSSAAATLALRQSGVRATCVYLGSDCAGIAGIGNALQSPRQGLSKQPRSAQAALADPYFAGLSQPAREPSAQPVSKLAFEFERRKLQVDEVTAPLTAVHLHSSACCSMIS